MQKFITLITILLCALYAEHAQAAGFLDGNQFFLYLEKEIRNTSDYEAGVASGYIIGIYDANNGTLFCPPNKKSPPVSVRQLQEIVYAYMQKHLDQWSNGASQSVINALKKTYPYPCD